MPLYRQKEFARTGIQLVEGHLFLYRFLNLSGISKEAKKNIVNIGQGF
jgi:hypothetical protein